MILNPNCSELVTRLEVILSIEKLKGTEIDALQNVISKETTNFTHNKLDKVITIYDYDSYYTLDETLSKLPFWNLIKCEEEEVTEYE